MQCEMNYGPEHLDAGPVFSVGSWDANSGGVYCVNHLFAFLKDYLYRHANITTVEDMVNFHDGLYSECPEPEDGAPPCGIRYMPGCNGHASFMVSLQMPDGVTFTTPQILCWNHSLMLFVRHIDGWMKLRRQGNE